MGRLKKFLATFESKNTIRGYQLWLGKFFNTIYGNGNLEEQVEKYFTENRNYKEDVQQFYVTIKNKSPSSVSAGLSAVRNFLAEQEIELSQNFWKKLRRRKGGRALTQDRPPKVEELRRILSHMDAKGRALYLTLASSGMRIGETLKLKLQDIDLTTKPPKIKISGNYTKNKVSRIAFISQEAKEAIDEWLKIRDSYLTAAIKKSTRFKKSREDERLFPFENTVGYMMWANAIRKAKFTKKDSETKRYELHPHVLRKFFRTRLGSVIQADLVEALMGHGGYLTEVYRRHTEEELAKFYLEGEPALLIFTETGPVLEMRKEIDERNKQLQTMINGLTTENFDLKQKMTEHEEQINTLGRTLVDYKGELDRRRTSWDAEMAELQLIKKGLTKILPLPSDWFKLSTEERRKLAEKIKQQIKIGGKVDAE